MLGGIVFWLMDTLFWLHGFVFWSVGFVFGLPVIFSYWHGCFLDGRDWFLADGRYFVVSEVVFLLMCVRFLMQGPFFWLVGL